MSTNDAPYDPPSILPHADTVPTSPGQEQGAFPAYTQPLATGDDESADITGLGGFPNAQFSRYSHASSLGGIPGMSRSDSTYTDGGASATEGSGIYAPVMGARPGSSLSSAGMLASSSSAYNVDPNRGSYVAAPMASPDLNKEGGFELAQAEKYAAGASGSGREYAMGAAGGGSLWARKKKWILAALAALLIIIAVAVAVPVSLANKNSSSKNNAVVANPASSTSKASKSSSTASASQGVPTVVSAAVFGAVGSTVVMADGSDGFTYENDFGGYWGWDASNPLDTSTAGRCQSWSPRLNETFRYGVDKIRGVNLGGWLNTEPFIVPGLYEQYANATYTPVDEWHLSLAMGDNLATAMENHYKTFVTERDFMEIAAAGFNYVRIPIGYWAIEVYEGEPFLEKVSWTYFLKAIEWARKYGLRINLDLHAVPGSQNGWNHSGKMDKINFMSGLMGLANGQRALNYVRTLAQFIAQPEYKDVVTMFGILNEPFIPSIGVAPIESWYTEAYDIVRSITGLGEGNGPWIAIHDGFDGVSHWAGFLSGSDRLSLDTHTYVAFDDPHTVPLSSFPAMACNNWGATVNTSMNAFGLTHSGEWSMAVNDCGKWVTGVGLGTRWQGNFSGYTVNHGSCDPFTDWRTWNATTIQAYQNFALASMDALQNYFFWTWKIGNSTVEAYTPNPMWNYQLGLEKGWSPKDPRAATGFCASLGVEEVQFDGTFPSAWMTGGAGAGTSVSTRNAWPPQSMTQGVSAAEMTQIPQFVMTGTPVTLPGPTYTTPGGTGVIPAGNGWANPSDTAKAYAKVSGCTYPDPWDDGTDSPGANACGAGAIPTALLKRAPQPMPAPTAYAPRR